MIKNNITIRSITEINTIQLPIYNIIDDYNNGLNTIELGDKYNCSNRLISKRLKQYDINITNDLNLPIKLMIMDYESGMSINEIAKKYKCSSTPIRKRFKYLGIQFRTISDARTLNLPMTKIGIDYKNGMDANEIGKKYGYSSSTIYDKLKQFDINIRTVKEVKNIISTYICIKCGHKFDGRVGSLYCPNCNTSRYCYKYNEECREQNREKYDRECFFCGMSEEETGRKHNTHHIDYNKNQGCDETPDWKLIPLCSVCHGITGGNKENRKTWKARILYLHKEYWLETS